MFKYNKNHVTNFKYKYHYILSIVIIENILGFTISFVRIKWSMDLDKNQI